MDIHASAGGTDAERLDELQAILNSAVDAIITIDARGRILSANKSTEDMFGYSLDELRGKDVGMLMPKPHREQHEEYLSEYIRTGVRKVVGIGREVVGCRRDGSTFPMHLAVSEVIKEGSRVFTGIARDISDLKEAEQRLSLMNEQLEQLVQERTAELRQAQAELVRKERLATLGQVSGGIAHEIRNPLNAVKMSAFFLLNAQQADEQKVREHLERIERQVNLIDNVITALTDVARLPDAVLSAHDVVEILQTVLSTISIPDNIETQLVADEGLPSVLVDANQVPLVFRNLVRNAREAMAEGGQLTISVSVVDDGVQVTVADTGVGIAEEQLQQIIEPLYSTKARGMGLGLAICQAVLKKNQGQLTVTSQLGQGSQFRVKLQAAK